MRGMQSAVNQLFPAIRCPKNGAANSRKLLRISNLRFMGMSEKLLSDHLFVAIAKRCRLSNLVFDYIPILTPGRSRSAFVV